MIGTELKSMLHERSQIQRPILYDSIYNKCLELSQKVEQWIPGAREKGKYGKTAHGLRVSFWGDEIVRYWLWLQNTVNILKTTELNILKW